ncbi:hypothetical protein BKA62DRAFT_698805 [Auriculariales sp. MPI-PUGE-AT-0066]|nr:hypothetical protein BKA62DRAFT_698805 [Auriculariales sp. MPI-PUGE-AT-0066]
MSGPPQQQPRRQGRVMTIEQFSMAMGSTWIAICARRGRYPRVITAADRAALTPRVDDLLADVQTLRAGGNITQRSTTRTRAPQAGGSASNASSYNGPVPVGADATTAVPAAAQSPQTGFILATIERLDQQMDSYENPDLQDEALTNIPFGEIHATADSMQSSPDTALPCFEDALAHAVIKWFKPNFFKWADPMECSACGGKMDATGSAIPTLEERAGGADRVELWKCPKDGTDIRFPRYNDLKYLMKSRLGRCGEFANLFTLMLRAVGLRARYVWNAEDHVWNEYYSPAQNRWIHVDSCECSRDEPSIYDRGWGKRMSYTIAFGIDGARDVSRRYIYPGGPGKPEDAKPGDKREATWEEICAARRTSIAEDRLEEALKAITRRRRMGRSEDEVKEFERADAAETEELLAQPAAKDGDVDGQGRTSGTKEWVESRGEGGTDASPAVATDTALKEKGDGGNS